MRVLILFLYFLLGVAIGVLIARNLIMPQPKHAKVLQEDGFITYDQRMRGRILPDDEKADWIPPSPTPTP